MGRSQRRQRGIDRAGARADLEPGAHGVDRARLRAVLAIAASVIIVGLAFAAFGWWRGRSGGAGGMRAVIVDQLAFTDPNPSFVEETAKELERAGYAVDYYPSDTVTVDFYRDLPSRGYGLIILRSHVSRARTVLGRNAEISEVGLFTNEPYNRGRHVDEQRAAQLTIDSYVSREDRYFGVEPSFIAQRTRGHFNGSTVILMGCAGLKTDDLAVAFMTRGAKDFVSWDAEVSATHTDKATAVLVRHLLSERLDLREAVARTMTEVGPDPSFGAHLLAYP